MAEGPAPWVSLRKGETEGVEDEVRRVCAEVRSYLEERARNRDGRLAVVLDVDETCLHSRPELDHLDAFEDVGAAWQAAIEWMARAEGRPIPPVLDLSHHVVSLGYTLFFVSGRPESLREATLRNLRAAGFPEPEGLFLEAEGLRRASASEHKINARRTIEGDGYRIVANVGDQASDLAGGHAERAFKIPNPSYVVP